MSCLLEEVKKLQPTWHIRVNNDDRGIKNLYSVIKKREETGASVAWLMCELTKRLAMEPNRYQKLTPGVVLVERSVSNLSPLAQTLCNMGALEERSVEALEDLITQLALTMHNEGELVRYAHLSLDEDTYCSRHPILASAEARVLGFLNNVYNRSMKSSYFNDVFLEPKPSNLHCGTALTGDEQLENNAKRLTHSEMMELAAADLVAFVNREMDEDD